MFSPLLDGRVCLTVFDLRGFKASSPRSSLTCGVLCKSVSTQKAIWDKGPVHGKVLEMYTHVRFVTPVEDPVGIFTSVSGLPSIPGQQSTLTTTRAGLVFANTKSLLCAY